VGAVSIAACIPSDNPSGDVSILQNTITGNNADWAAGVLAISRSETQSGNVILKNNVITGNIAREFRGGGVFAESNSTLHSGNVYLSSNIIIGNRMDGDFGGGGVAAASISESGDAGDVILTNNIIAENTGHDGGGAEAFSVGRISSGVVTLTNNTITRNNGAVGGGVRIAGDRVNVYNNIIWGNWATISGDDIYLAGSGNGYNNNYEDLYGVWTNSGYNINIDPLFVDPSNQDFHLSRGSECVDAGTNRAPELPDNELDAKPRIIDGDSNKLPIADMGAYEYGDICEGDFDGDLDQDGGDLAAYANNNNGYGFSVFAADFSRNDCPVYLLAP
jgi:hypothetical protein